MCHWFTPRPVLSRCGCKRPIVLTWLALLRSRLTRLTSTSLWLLSWSSWRSPSRSLSPSLPSFTASKHFLLSDCLWCSGLRAERLENVCLCVCVCVCVLKHVRGCVYVNVCVGMNMEDEGSIKHTSCDCDTTLSQRGRRRWRPPVINQRF